MTGVHGRVVARRGRHREDRAVVRIERDDRAAARVPLLVRLSEADAVLQRLLRRRLKLGVDGQPHVVARLRDRRRREAATRAPERVDVQTGATRDSAQVAVVRRLHPALPDLVAGLVVLLRTRRELRRRDLADVAEHLRRERVVRVVANERPPRRHSRELRGVLVQVVDHRVARGLAHRHRRHQIVRVPPRLDSGCDLVQGDARHLGDLAQLRVPGRVDLGQVAGPQEDRRRRRVRHERDAVPVDDLSPRRLHAHGAERVCRGLLHVRRPREDLQRPEPQDEDGEDHEHRDAEHAHPPEQARVGPIRLLDALARRQEPLRARTLSSRGASQAAAPRSRSRRARAGAGAHARAHTSGL
jgi:hypothetical protein